jgi:hypothetical protein
MSKYASSVTQALTKFIVQQGEICPVTRPSTKTTHSYYCQGQALSIEQAVKYEPQGADNAGNSQPHLFAFPPICDVRVGDKVQYGGNTYRIVSAITNRIEAQAINLECVGVRE